MPATAYHCRLYRAKLRDRALLARGLWLDICEFCGSTKKLEWAHTISTGLQGPSRGFTRRYLDVIKHPTHYKRLCKNCHYKYDNCKEGYSNE